MTIYQNFRAEIDEVVIYFTISGKDFTDIRKQLARFNTQNLEIIKKDSWDRIITIPMNNMELLND